MNCARAIASHPSKQMESNERNSSEFRRRNANEQTRTHRALAVRLRARAKRVWRELRRERKSAKVWRKRVARANKRERTNSHEWRSHEWNSPEFRVEFVRIPTKECERTNTNASRACGAPVCARQASIGGCSLPAAASSVTVISRHEDARADGALHLKERERDDLSSGGKRARIARRAAESA